ncbi:MAG: TraR/DksA C4-type zinc finger protein [Chloroflexota bacterium]|nr:TraR/DksA C4-type zinc finger protein [Chloroflexota bacterium]
MTAEEQKLKEKLARSQEELETLNKRLQDRPELGLGTGSTGVYSWEMALARSGRIEQQIEELQQALARVAAGDYGRCDMCGERIDPERLEIVPATTLCAKCARSHAAQANGPATSRTAVL